MEDFSYVACPMHSTMAGGVAGEPCHYCGRIQFESDSCGRPIKKKEATVNPFDQFSQLKSQQTELEAELAEVESKLEALAPIVLDHLDNLGLANAKLADNKGTIYVHKQTWAGVPEGVEREDLAKELLRHDETAYLAGPNFNTHSLSGWLREQIDQDTLPDWARAAIKRTDVRSVRIRKT